jgi:CDP-diacylglycerol pyrophosphatase
MLPPTLGKAISGIEKVDAPTDPSPSVRPVFYTNRTVRFWMDAQGMRNRNVLLTVNDSAGRPQDVFRGIPVKISDRLLTTEAAVS